MKALTVEEIAEVCGVSRRAIRNRCSALGVGKSGRDLAPTEEETAAILALYGKGEADLAALEEAKTRELPGTSEDIPAFNKLRRDLDAMTAENKKLRGRIAELEEAKAEAEALAAEYKEAEKEARAAADREREALLEDLRKEREAAARLTVSLSEAIARIPRIEERPRGLFAGLLDAIRGRRE